MQGGKLRRESDQRIDEKYLLEFLRAIAARNQQVTDLVLRIQKHHAHGIEPVRVAQTVDHGVQQRTQAIGAQAA